MPISTTRCPPSLFNHFPLYFCSPIPVISSYPLLPKNQTAAHSPLPSNIQPPNPSPSPYLSPKSTAVQPLPSFPKPIPIISHDLTIDRIMSSQLHIQNYVMATSQDIRPKNLDNLFTFRMVKVRAFCGAVFSPQDYPLLLKNNIEHLQSIPMSKTFNTAQMIANGRLSPEESAFFYIYKQEYQNHTSFGLLAEISVQDYHENKIKRHQKTLNRAHLNHHTYKEQHVGPVVVSHREDLALKRMVLQLTQENEVFARWHTSDGREHTLWKVRREKSGLQEKFGEIDCLYILDGHHRMHAAHENYLLGEKTEKDQWIQALLYSSQYVVVHPQHRVLPHIPTTINIYTELSKIDRLQITRLPSSELTIKDQLEQYQIIMKQYDQFYGINFKHASRSTLEKVSSVRLQKEIFDEILGEEVMKALKYVPGIIQEERINEHDIVFYVRQPMVQTLFQVADQNVTMPPKSTWIEPKPCSHMVIRL